MEIMWEAVLLHYKERKTSETYLEVIRKADENEIARLYAVVQQREKFTKGSYTTDNETEDEAAGLQWGIQRISL